jgi:thiol-disulfide isomerase/thioredoxin
MLRDLSRLLLVTIMAASLVACSDDSGTTPTPDQGAGDQAVGDQGVTPDTGPSCDYPAGPYGTSEGKIVENFEFTGFADAQYLCKTAKDQVMDLSASRKISFKDFYCNTGCSSKKRRLLWVMVSAGWCGPCHQEVSETQAQYEKGNIDAEVHLLNVVYEDDNSKPATEAFTKLWAKNSKFQISFPVAMDPTFQMGKYFDRNAVPFNMIVDLDTMEIIFRQTGANLPAVGQAIFSHLNK